MPAVLFQGQSYALLENETVLDALLRNGIAITNSCRAGVCGACLMRSASAGIPDRAQAGMKESWKARGYFYSCSCIPSTDLEIDSADADTRFHSTIESLAHLSADVLEVRLQTDVPVDFRAGQYVTVARDSLARSYSIASLPEESVLTLHVRRIPGGRMSGWFHDEARVGDRLTVLGPSGECFYVSGREDQALVLAGTGTGLAPLYGIVRDALRSGHHGPIHLFHGALQEAGLYLVKELREMVRNHPQLIYTPTVLGGTATEGVAIGPIDQVIRSQIPKMSGWRGFVCGDPAIVQTLKKKWFLSGMASKDIYSDAFLPAAAPFG